MIYMSKVSNATYLVTSIGGCLEETDSESDELLFSSLGDKIIFLAAGSDSSLELITYASCCSCGFGSTFLTTTSDSLDELSELLAIFYILLKAFLSLISAFLSRFLSSFG
jgi:hypothetical protein